MSDNGTFSWGEKLSSKAPNYAKKFFRTGFTTNNSISLSGGNENIQSYFPMPMSIHKVSLPRMTTEATI